MDKVPSKGGKPTRSIAFTLLSLKGFKAHLSALSALKEEESSRLIHPFHDHLPTIFSIGKLTSLIHLATSPAAAPNVVVILDLFHGR